MDDSNYLALLGAVTKHCRALGSSGSNRNTRVLPLNQFIRIGKIRTQIPEQICQYLKFQSKNILTNLSV